LSLYFIARQSVNEPAAAKNV